MIFNVSRLNEHKDFIYVTLLIITTIVIVYINPKRMLWVLAALVLMIVALLLHFLKQIMAAVAKNRYYPPSDAFIDQVLPEVINS